MENAQQPELRKLERITAAEGLQFSELLQIINLRKKFLIVFSLMALIGVTIRQVVYIPTFSASTTLSIQKIENSPMQMALANLGTIQIDSSDRLKKYMDYMSSAEFFLSVAETLKFKEGYQLLNLTPPSELSMFKKKFWLHFVSNNFGRRPTPQNAPEPVLLPVEKLAGFLRSVTTAEPIGTEVIRIHVTTLDPLTSMILANSITEVFVSKTSERDYNEVTEVKKFIEHQLDSTTDRLKRSETELVDYKKHHNIVSISSEHTAFAEKLNHLETELETAKIKFQQNEKVIDYYEKLLDSREKKMLSDGSASVSSSAGETIARLRRRLDALQQRKILQLDQGMDPNSIQISEINREIDAAAAQLKVKLQKPEVNSPIIEEEGTQNLDSIRTKIGTLKTENKALDINIKTLEATKEGILKGIRTLPQEEQELLNLSKGLELQFELYSMLKKKLQEVEIQQVALQSRVQVTERAGMGSPIPRTGFLLKSFFALLVSCFLGSTLAFLLEALDPTVKHLLDLDRLEVVTLGSIPRLQASLMRQSLGTTRTYRPDLLVCREKPESGESMAFKYIRVQITKMRAADGNPAKIISFTSPERGDGKSLACSNIAVSLSQLEKRTLLIDADFRNPSVPWYFGYKDGPGLSSVLALKASLDEVLIRERLPFLDILPAGWPLPNPTELLSNDKFRLLLDHLREQYDYIIIDSPPAIAVVDAAVVANLADSTIMVVRFRKTKKHLVLLALKKILQVCNKHVYGLLNGVGEVHDYESYSQTSHMSDLGSHEAQDSQAELERFNAMLKQNKAS